MWKFERALELLDKQGRTRKWLAEQCGIEITSLNHLLIGSRVPSRPVLLLMARALECKVEDLAPTEQKTG